MRSLDGLSGPWAGWWTQGRVRGTMRLRLTIANGVIEGSAIDRSGPFEMRGSYDLSNRVRIVKRYPLLQVNYNGTWDGVAISGTSTIIAPGFFDTGTFELWPESDEAAISELIEGERVLSEP